MSEGSAAKHLDDQGLPEGPGSATPEGGPDASGPGIHGGRPTALSACQQSRGLDYGAVVGPATDFSDFVRRLDFEGVQFPSFRRNRTSALTLAPTGVVAVCSTLTRTPTDSSPGPNWLCSSRRLGS